MRTTLDHLPERNQQEIRTLVRLLLETFKASFSPIVHSPTDVNARLKEGHYFFKDIRQDGVLLYDGNHKQLVVPGNLLPDEEKEIAERCFELLVRAYVEARYSAYYKITEEELVWLGEQVAALQSLTEAVCRDKI
ncbi:MAG: hypothetical protein PVJ68_07330 [Candidatus Thiodiazotropha sp.]|jgi:hypothetical protein